jgi:hypothetical protein
MSRRGQGISVNVIIIAAVALIVLVILSVLVFRSGRVVGEQTGQDSCLARAGVCREYGAGDPNRLDPQQPGCYRGETRREDLTCEVGICCVFDFSR